MQKNICPGYPNCPECAKDSAFKTRFIIADKTGHKAVLCRQIKYLQADRQYTNLYFGNENTLLSRQLGNIEPQLPPCFMRIHKSYIVNLNFTEHIVKDKQQVRIIINGKSLPVSRRKIGKTFRRYENFCADTL